MHKLLIVDDEPGIRESLTGILEDEGYQVESAASGEAGLELIRKTAFDVILLATGFAAALGPLGGGVRTDAKGFALRSDRVTSSDHAKLWFVGHNYDSSGGLSNIRRDSSIVAELIAGARGSDAR